MLRDTTVLASLGSTAFVFPGVGVKLCGYEREFAQAHWRRFGAHLTEASRAARVDLADAFRQGALGIRDSRPDHFFTYAYSCAMVDLCCEHGLAPDLMAGYSFGIYAALYGSGALSFADGLAAIGRAYDLMDTASRGRDYTMALTIGLGAGEIDEVLSSGYFDRLCMVNSNNDTCKVFAGPRQSLARFIEEARRRDALDARLLDVSIPYHHSRLLDGVSGAFHAFLQTLNWNPPLCPVVSSIDQGLLTSAEELVDFAAANLSTPINWERVAAALHGRGVARAIECGAGISLTQNGRFMPFHIEYVNIKTLGRKLGL